MPDVIEIPLQEIGLDTRPKVRQIRPLDWEHVHNLMETSDPAEWDAILVRQWPETDPYPTGEEGRRYQVVSGYHRTSAARELGLETIRAEVREVPDDTAFLLLAYEGNARHGKPMSNDEKREIARSLRNLDMSENDIARKMGVARGTIHNWLSGRDTNAGRQKDVRTHKASGVSEDVEDGGLPHAWRVTPSAPLDAQRAAVVANTITDFLALTPTHLTPEEVIAWVNAQPPITHRSLVLDLTRTINWLGSLRMVLDMQGAA